MANNLSILRLLCPKIWVIVTLMQLPKHLLILRHVRPSPATIIARPPLQYPFLLSYSLHQSDLKRSLPRRYLPLYHQCPSGLILQRKLWGILMLLDIRSLDILPPRSQMLGS